VLCVVVVPAFAEGVHSRMKGNAASMLGPNLSFWMVANTFRITGFLLNRSGIFFVLPQLELEKAFFR